MTKKKPFKFHLPFLIVTMLFVYNITSVDAKERFCSKTSQAAFKACNKKAKDDYWITIGNCNNLFDAEDRADCRRDAKAKVMDDSQACQNQRQARLGLCTETGEAPYDPALDPDDFFVPSEITTGNANEYFPLIQGTKWVYEARGASEELLERITIIVTKDVKTIEYPENSGNLFRCTVINDVVEAFIGGDENDDDNYIVIEDTLDWYIQSKETNNVVYMGENVRDFEEDLDGKAELVAIDGSWKAGRESSKPGILMWGDPDPDGSEHPLYRQEFSLGNAEDVAELISKGEESVSVPFGTYEEDVLKTKDWTPIAPEVFEYKFYAPGIGMVEELNPETGEHVVLIEKSTIQLDSPKKCW